MRRVIPRLGRSGRLVGGRRRRRAIWLSTFVLLAVASVVVGGGSAPPRAEAAVLAKDISINQAGPLGAVTVIGDSVLLGAGIFSPTLPDQLIAHGWGPIRYRAGLGYQAGPGNRDTTAAWWIQTWRAAGWDAPNVIVNLGANDSGICRTNVTCARNRILDVVNAIGPGHRIWWPQITRASDTAALASTWNLALRQIAAERADFFTWDWPLEMAGGGYPSHDGIHLSPDGYRKRSLRMAQEFTATLAVAQRVGGDAALPAATAGAGRFVPLTPERIIDTRVDAPGRRPDGAEVAVTFGNRLPAGATAVALNITAAGPSAPGYLTARPCGRSSDASTVNYRAGGARAAMTVVPLGADGKVCVSNRGETDVIVDLQGAFVPGSGSGLTPLASNQRLIDTRARGRATRLVVPTPAGASAVAVNLTVANAAEGGWLRAAPCGSSTGVSNVNFEAGEDIAGAAFVATAADRTICIDITTAAADVIVDLTGTFGSGGLAFVPASPTRMLDTRNAIGGWAPIHGRDQTLDVGVAPASAAAVTGTLTLVEPTTGGFLVGHRCGSVPPTSSVNAGPGQVLANLVTTGITGGRLCVTSSALTHTLFDVTGWWVS